MGRRGKLMHRVLSGTSDNNIDFADLRTLLHSLGFHFRVKGSHFIYYREDIDDIINLQPLGSKAKGYQVKHVRNIVLKYKLGGDIDA